MKPFKRSMLLAATVLSGALMLTACSGGSAPAPAPADKDEETTTEVTSVEEVKYGSWQPGAAAVSNMWTYFLSEDAELQEKHGLKFTNEIYSNLESLYTDLSLGRVQGVSAGPSAMAQQATQGAPVRMISTSARSTAAILSTGKEWTAENLKGARLVAPTSTATWADVQGQIEETFGLVPGDYELVSTKDLAGPVTQLAANTADFAMTWGEYIPSAMQEYDNIVVVADPATLAAGGKIPWQFSISVHESVSDEAAKRLRGAATEIVAWMVANPDKVEEYALSTGQKPGVAETLITSGAQTFEFNEINADVRAELEQSFTRLIDMGRMEALPPETFYGK